MTEKSLEQILQEQRKYAAFFEWPDKQSKECGIVQCLLESMENHGLAPFTGLRPGPSPNHAPDCIAEDKSGETVAIEVTEFVSRKAIEMNQRGKNVYHYWKPDEVINEVKKIITQKDGVTYRGGPYSKIVLVIHTDEIALDHETYSTVLSGAAFEAQTIDGAFFLFSYRPQVKSYPHVQLNLMSNKPLEPIR
ncbi:MAG: hypothetical protein AB1553_07620 [Nitrospirota bacterium]